MDAPDTESLVAELQRLQQQVNTLRARLNRIDGGVSTPAAVPADAPPPAEFGQLSEVVKHLHHYVSSDMKREVADFVDALVTVHLQAGGHADRSRG